MIDTTIKYTCSKINWDTDGDQSICDELPKSITISVPEDIAQNEDSLMDYLSDSLSDETGWCHFGFAYAKA